MPAEELAHQDEIAVAGGVTQGVVDHLEAIEVHQRHGGRHKPGERGRGDRLAFSSGIVRDVLYANIARRKRRALHRKYAEELVAHAPLFGAESIGELHAWLNEHA